MVFKATYLKQVQTVCHACMAFISQGIAINNFDVICLKCAEGIAQALPYEITQETAKPMETAAELPNKTGVYTCQICQKTFYSKQSYGAHYKIHGKKAGVKDAVSG